jgi:hypothetical protein
MIAAVCLATFGDPFTLFDFAGASTVSTILVGHSSSPPSVGELELSNLGRGPSN